MGDEMACRTLTHQGLKKPLVLLIPHPVSTLGAPAPDKASLSYAGGWQGLLGLYFPRQVRLSQAEPQKGCLEACSGCASPCEGSSGELCPVLRCHTPLPLSWAGWEQGGSQESVASSPALSRSSRGPCPARSLGGEGRYLFSAP